MGRGSVPSWSSVQGWVRSFPSCPAPPARIPADRTSVDGIGGRQRFFEPAAGNDLLARAGYPAHEGKERVDFVWGEHGGKWLKDKDGALPLQECEDFALFFSLIGVRKNTVPA
jgi:hypothetical protein